MALEPTAEANPRPTDLESAGESRQLSRAGLWACGLGLVGLLASLIAGDERWGLASFVVFLVGPLLGTLGLLTAVEELRRGTRERAHAARSTLLGALALGLPWVVMVVLAFGAAFVDD